jgi:hypothetical protein
MFEDQPLFVMIQDHAEGLQVYKMETTREAQTTVCGLLSIAAAALIDNKEPIPFDGGYKPEFDEILVIHGFKLNPQIVQALKDPIGVAAFIPDKDNPPTIKAVFTGKQSAISGKEQVSIAFQKFRKEQYITTRKGVNLFHSKETFTLEQRFGLCITDVVDCVIVNNELRFSSFFFARQVFDLSEYYREATDSDVDNFINNSKINVEDGAIFKTNADSWVRRKIAIITDLGILDKHKVPEIKLKAKAFGLTIKIVKNKIHFPNDKRELKTILKFLDDEIYKGVLSEQILQTNSKRKAEI